MNDLFWWLHCAQIGPRSSKLARHGRASQHIGGTGGNGAISSVIGELLVPACC